MPYARQKASTRATPVWAGDFGGREHIVAFPARIDPTQFTDQSGVSIAVSGPAAQNATSIPVQALAGPILPFGSTATSMGPLIPSGSLINFAAAASPTIANPATAPTLTTATTGGTIPGGTYWVAYTYKNAAGETAASPAASIVVPTTTATNTITDTAPALPAGATGINAYIGAAANDLVFAGTSATNVVVITAEPPATAAAPSASNMTGMTAGTGKYAQLTADANLGDTALTVAPLPTALTGTETGNFSRWGVELMLSGTPVGRTYVQRAANGPFVPADPVAHAPAVGELYLVVFDNADLISTNGVELYRHNSIVKENYLPGYSTVLNPGGVASPLLTLLRQLYTCIQGRD
ncbi:MAG: hypothetical protein LC772_06580 [Chloroflexi bacterium]|nr:hypothetical protein [Chloroflexota bacterium]